MKKALLPLLILSLSLLTACAANRPAQQPSENQTGNQTENQTGNDTQMQDNQPQNAGQNNQTDGSQNQQEGQLTAEAAQLRALSHAQLKAEEVTGLRSEYDREDNAYEIDFIHDGWEFEYEIDAINGEVLSSTQKRVG